VPTVADVAKAYSQLTLRQPGILPEPLTGPLPSAIAKGVLGAGIGYLAAPLIASTHPNWDRKRLRTALTIGGAGLGAATSIPDIKSSDNYFGSYPFNKAAKYSFSSVQVPVAGELAKKVFNLANEIPDIDLADKGRADHPHVTALYGLHTNNVLPVHLAMRKHGASSMKFGKTSLFTGSPDYDVLKVDVDSPELHQINASLRQLPHTNKFPEFKPHMTVAYVKKGAGNKYVGREDLSGSDAPLNSVEFSPASGKPQQIVLNKSVTRSMAKASSETDNGFSNFGPPTSTYFGVVPAAQTVLDDPWLDPVGRALALHVISEAQNRKKSPLISTGDLVHAAVGAGLCYAAGNVAGRVMGAIFGLPPELQQRAAQMGALGGILKATGILE
jgi:2'-5' RNA ligase